MSSMKFKVSVIPGVTRDPVTAAGWIPASARMTDQFISVYQIECRVFWLRFPDIYMN